MHLLFVCDRYPPEPGANAAGAARIASSLAGLGHAVQVLAFAESQPPGRSAMQLADFNLTVHRFGPFADDSLTSGQFLRLAEWLHRRQRFDGVWAHGAGSVGFQATWLGRRLGVPVLLAVRGGELDGALFPPGDFGRLGWCVRSATCLAVDSADAAAQVRALVGRDAFLLPCAVDAARFCPGPRPGDLALRYALPADVAVLGLCGGLRDKNGLEHVVRAFREVRAARPCRLLPIGDVHPDDRAAFAREVARPPDGSRDVVWPGRLTDPVQVARHLRLCDVFLLPSPHGEQPDALLEAMASGVPVVASEAGGIPELIGDGRTGVLVPRTHPHLFGRRVLGVLEWPPERRRAVAEAARDSVVAGHSLERERERLAALMADFRRLAPAPGP
jgi:glycosyltransferase involved in cell wall biosynthesis